MNKENIMGPHKKKFVIYFVCLVCQHIAVKQLPLDTNNLFTVTFPGNISKNKKIIILSHFPTSQTLLDSQFSTLNGIPTPQNGAPTLGKHWPPSQRRWLRSLTARQRLWTRLWNRRHFLRSWSLSPRHQLLWHLSVCLISLFHCLMKNLLKIFIFFHCFYYWV